ncbi:MAG: PKD domain-containing protein [Saprospirales bacterium]|nr:PKD domain-containing protein [Saprospirales bacterium]
MELALDYGLPLLYNTSGADFPYEVKDVLKIRRSNGPNGLQRWYYFYDWQIEYDEICGRTAVDVDIAGTGEAPAADFSASSDTLMLEGGSAEVDFTDLSVGADSWFWNFGDGATSTDQNPSYSYTLPGLYTVSLSAAGADGCASSAFRNILVTEMVSATFEPASDKGLRVFPNPAQQWLEVSWEGEARELRVFDAIGRPLRLLQVEGNQARVMLDGLSNGLYFVSVDGRTAKFQIMR